MKYPSEEKARIKRGRAGVAAIAVAALVLCACRSRDQADATGASQNAQPATVLRVDNEARLFVQGRDSMPVAADEKALDELTAALGSRDGKLESLIASGKVFTVPNNTRIRIMETGFTKTRIRVLEGDKIMQEGWVSERWIR